MHFVATKIPGVYVVELERKGDERGFFARSWCENEFQEQGLVSQFVQCNISYSAKRGTLRGMHWQTAPHEEVKLVRCTMGAFYDVIVDVRPDSPTFCKWEAFELTADNRRALYIPAGIAHGLQTLTDDTEAFYQMSAYYHAESASGVRWNDPAFRIVWPLAERTLSERDAGWPDFTP